MLYKAGAATQPDFDDTRAQEQARRPRSTTPRPRSPRPNCALSYCDLRAPFDSWVLKRNVDVGTLVGPATNGFTLADTRTVKAVFGVPDTAIGRIKLGSPQTVTTEALPDPLLRTRDRDLGGRRSQEPRLFGRGPNRQSQEPAEVAG